MNYTNLCKNLYERCTEIGELLEFDVDNMEIILYDGDIHLHQSTLWGFRFVSLKPEHLSESDEVIIEYCKNRIVT